MDIFLDGIYFIDFMLADRTLIDYTSLFWTFNFEENENIILSYFKIIEVTIFKFKWSNKT